MSLLELRKKTGLTQKEVAEKVGISLRTYSAYEKHPEIANKIKYNYVVKMMEDMTYIDETTGMLTIESITDICRNVLSQYDVEFCYLFGSYAKGTATEKSDVDLLISSNVQGLQFFGMVETLRARLKKKVDVLNLEQLNNNLQLTREILKDGIKIYG